MSTAHIPPPVHRRGNLRVAEGGNYASVDFGRSPGRLGGGGLRDVVKEFTPASRRRLMVTLNSIDRSRVPKPFFVTLTWHESWPHTSEGRQRQLDALLKRLERVWGHFPSVWRVEWKERKTGLHKGQVAPHVHLLIFLDPEHVVGGYLPKKQLQHAAETRLRNRIAFSWNELVAAGDEDHLKVAVRRKTCTLVESWKGANAYASKYMSKLESFDPGSAGIGRNWGARRKDLLSIKLWRASITMRDAMTIRRIFRRFSGSRYRNHRGDLQSASCFLSCSTSTRLLRWLGYYADPPPDAGAGPRLERSEAAAPRRRNAGSSPIDPTHLAAGEGVIR